MTNKPRTKVRLVKCPKCTKILPEPEQVPLYTCGVCGTILQAKYYKGDNTATELGSREQGAALSNGIGHAARGGESGSSNQGSSSAGEQLSEKKGNDQNTVGNCNTEQSGAANPVHNTSLSEESSFVENKVNGETDDKTNQIITANTSVEHENKQDIQCGGVAVGNHSQEQFGEVNSARETSTLNDSQVLENKEPLRFAPDNTVLVENTELQQLPMVNGAIQDMDNHDEQSHNRKLIREVKSAREASVLNESVATEKKEPLKLDPRNEKLCDGSDNMLEETRKEQFEGKNSDETIVVSEVNCHDTNKSLVVAKTAKDDDSGKDQNGVVEQLGNIKLSEDPLSTEISQEENDDSTEGFEPSSRVSAPLNARDLRTTHESLGNVAETSTQKIENLDECAVNGSEQVRSVTEPVIKEDREVGSSLNVVPPSLAYDGSVSSFEGNDDQITEKQEDKLEATLQGNSSVLGFVGAEESPEWNNVPSRTHGNSGIHNQAQISSEMLPNGKLKSSIIEEEESLQQNGIPVGRNRIRPQRNGFPPRVPFYRRSEAAYETGSCSSYIHDELPSHHHMRHHPYQYEDSEPWLRKTYTQNRRRFPEEAYWRENEFQPQPMYYDYETSGEIYHRSRYHDYTTDRRRRTESWSQSGSSISHPRMAYSGEVFNNGRYQTRDPYMMHHRPDHDRRWSVQLPPRVPATYSRQGLYPAPLRETDWDPYDSLYPTSPQRFMEHESNSWAQDTISLSEDQRYNNQVMRRLYNLREKRQAMKRQLHPMSGGAPFISCNFCFNVLQLPEDLPSRRRKGTHRLKCGFCSNIVKISLDNDSRGNSSVTREAPQVQYSDGRESSTVEKRELESSTNSKGGERLEGSQEAATTSVEDRQKTKVSWQLPAKSKSPLHRLMGYSSPHELLNEDDFEDIE